MLAINPKIKQKADDIRHKIYGGEVRESLASGIEAISEDVEATIGRQDVVERYNNQMITEMTDKDIISAPEIIAARGGKTTLGQRLDETDAQLAQNVPNANLVDKLEKLIQYRGMYARVASDNSIRIGIGMSNQNKDVIEYRFVYNADGLLLLRGVLAGRELVSANLVDIILDGTFNTNTAGQAYTNVVGSKLKFEFTGQSLRFNRWMESRGGLWKIKLSNGLERYISCYAPTGRYREDLIFDNLPYDTYKGEMEFMGDDPFNPPSSSPSRGYFYYAVGSSTVKPLRFGKVLPINETTAKYIIANNTVTDYAIQGRKAGTNTAFEWSPVHGTVTGVSEAISMKLILDGNIEVSSPSVIPSFTYKEISSFELFQRFDVRNPNATGDGVLWKHYLNHVINSRNPYLTLQNMIEISQDTEFGLGYFGMLGSLQSTMSRMVLSNGARKSPLPTDGSNEYYSEDVMSAAFTGENYSGVYHGVAIDASSGKDVYNLGKSFEPTNKARASFRADNVAKFYFTSFQGGVAPSGARLSCQNRICAVTGVAFPNVNLGI